MRSITLRVSAQHWSRDRPSRRTITSAISKPSPARYRPNPRRRTQVRDIRPVAPPTTAATSPHSQKNERRKISRRRERQNSWEGDDAAYGSHYQPGRYYNYSPGPGFRFGAPTVEPIAQGGMANCQARFRSFDPARDVIA